MAENNKIKIAGYAKRIFFNDNIEYRNFSPSLVGLQLTSEGGTTQFTNGNFSIDVNLDPKPDVVFTQGTKSKLFCLDDVVDNPIEQTIQKNLKTKLNLDLTNPLSYIWYGSAKELVRVSLLEIQDNWPAAVYVDNKVGSVTGNNITNYVYNISANESTFTVNSRFFVNPYNIVYTLDSQYTPTEDTSNKLRNFTTQYTSYNIEHNGISKPIISITPATQKTNSDLKIVVKGNPFPELTGILIPTLTFLLSNVDASIPYFIKPNETEEEKFFSGLNNLQRNILNRDIYPKYTSEIISTNYTDDGVLLTSKKTLLFPILEDGYNLNFFNSFYLSYLTKLSSIGDNLDESSTDTIIRKYTTEAINSFDTLPSENAEDITLNGEKATKLLRIYGVEFDEIKKFINGIKFAHVVTYDKKNNVPDTLLKDLSHMLGLDPVTLVTTDTLNMTLLPSNGVKGLSGSSVNYTQSQLDIELYRRLILNISWIWKSKGSRKAVEFLFRFIGAPESLVNFNEYIVMVDKPLDMDKIKDLLYIYTGGVSTGDLENIPYDDNGYPLPPINGDIVITDYFDPQTGEIVENAYTDMYFQKAGGWYRETYGGDSVTVLRGNNPHVGPYDGGSEYLQYFSRCYIPNFNSEPTITVTANTATQNYFTNYNYGIFNGIPTGTTEFFTTQLTYNSITNGYQPMDECVNVNYSIIETSLQNDGLTTIQQALGVAEQEYESFQAQIQQPGNSYLAYSPEWQTIQNNLEVAQYNASTEVVTEGCGLNSTTNGNNTLQICIEELITDILPFNCDTLSAVTDCSPFLYYVDPINGQKVSFDEFSQCCSDYGSGDYEYVSYINSAGRKSEYCSALAPCVGDVHSVQQNGIVVFNVVGNNLPPDTYEVYSQTADTTKCVQFNRDGTGLLVTHTSLTTQEILDSFQTQLEACSGTYCYDLTQNPTPTIEQWIFSFPSMEYATLGQNANIWNNFISIVQCITTTKLSSPECCAWHGYDYQIWNSGNAIFQTEVQTQAKYVVCVTNTNSVNELIPSEVFDPSNYYGSSLPQINLSASTTYNEFSNPSGQLNGFYTTDVYRDCLNESLIITGFKPGATTFISPPNAIFPTSSLNTPSNWEVSSIDQYGRVSFKPIDPLENYISDWNSQGIFGTLYQEIAEYYGYQFGDFTFNCYNVLIPYSDLGEYSDATIDTSAAVDSSKIGKWCDDINNVAVVFGSENWQGFKLPEIVDCSCTVDFSFDYMLKYDVENLMECTQKDLCYPTIFNEVSLGNIDCRNFIVFTVDEEHPDNENSLINNFNSSSTPIEEYVVWSNNSCILEPSLDCCNAIGGNVVLVTSWAQTNINWVNDINTLYDEIKDGNIPTLTPPLPIGLTNYIEDYTTIVNEINHDISNHDCSTYTLVIPPLIDSCDIDYNEYIKTQNVCSLDVPLECGLWTKTLTDYRNLIVAVNTTINQFTEECGEWTANSPIKYNKPTSDAGTGIVKAVQNKNKLLAEKDSGLKTLSKEREKLVIKISDINNVIESKKEDGIVISQAITAIETKLDCGVYENKLKEINNFNYKSFCSSDTKTQYRNCVNAQTLINQEQKILYTDLLENCRLNNSLQSQLTKAKFDNNSELINILQKEIFITETKIDTLTKGGAKFIESDPSQQTSTLQVNNKIETITRTAELLDTTTDKITNSNGILTLTTLQKTTLSIISIQDQSKISSLLIERGELQLLLDDITSKYSRIATNKNNGLSGRLLSWGVGLIGAGLFLKELLDPEIVTGVVNAAIWTMPQQLFKAEGDVTTTIGPDIVIGGGGSGSGTGENVETGGGTNTFCDKYSDDPCSGVIINIDGDLVICESAPANVGGEDYNYIPIDCCNYNTMGYAVTWVPATTDVAAHCEPGTAFCVEPIIDNSTATEKSSLLLQSSTPNCCPSGAEYIPTPTSYSFFIYSDLGQNTAGNSFTNYNLLALESDLSNSDYYTMSGSIGGGGFGSNNFTETTTWVDLSNTVGGNVHPTTIILDGNGEPIPESCCTQEITGYPVAPYILGTSQQSLTSSLNIIQANYIGCFCTAECIDIVDPPPPYECPTEIMVEDGMLMDGPEPILEQCCISGSYSNIPGVNGLAIEPVFLSGEYIGCAVIPEPPNPCCDVTIIQALYDTLEDLESKVLEIEKATQSCYGEWLDELNGNYDAFLITQQSNYLSYLDDLKINFKLFVNNTNVNTNTNIDTDLTYLPYTQSINPIWEWDPTQQYSGVVLSGSEIDLATVEESISEALAAQGIDFSTEMFEPNWNTLNFTIPECVCADLRRLYPDKEFFFSIEIENYECSLCLLVDNILVNVTDCKKQRLLSLNECLIPQLSCVIDNKKSWVYTDKGVVTETIYPEGGCNTMSTSNYNVTKLTTPEDRLWTNLEYRYTNYEVNHSDLIVNVKNTSFSIDPAKAIECDVYDFWKNIDCGNCPTSCTTGETITFSGQVYTSTTLGDYTLDVSASTSGILFSCDTYTSILTDQVLELKNDYYSLTADYNESLDANYYDLLNKGGNLSKFYIQKNNCGSDTIVINNNNNLDNLFGLITEDNDGTLSFYESYIYSGSTPYVGGALTEVISGITAQTFNQTTGVTSECCTSLNGLINDKGTLGLGIGKNYVWDTTTSSCNWKEINSCKGDCEYSGSKKVISREDCLSGITTGTTVDVCINPLDYLDFTPSQVITKENFDSMVLSNLIDVKSRQTISDYPTLRLFYQLYLTASNCGEELSGKLTYNSLFEFMDKIGDYWLDLLEQVVPSTTIWEGCDNSGKIFRNTIFDQNKFNYKKYNLNFFCEGNDECQLTEVTDFSIGSQDVYTILEEIPLYPTNAEILLTKNEILTNRVVIATTQRLLLSANTQLCSLNLQDNDVSGLSNSIETLNVQISGYNQTLITAQSLLPVLLIQLEDQQTEYLLQQENYYSKYMSCSGLTQSLVTAQSNLTNFIPGTTNYERQRNFIANIRSKLTKCIKSSNLLLTNENCVAFITQIYDTNEYEGNITIMGDNDWSDEGPFYNTELIHNC